MTAAADDAISGSDAVFFGFESDFVASMRCIPMAARLRLDLSGVKLKLNEWAKLGLPARAEAATLPCAGPADIAAYKEKVSARVAEACGAPPSLLPELPAREWDDGQNLPAQVMTQAEISGRHITQDAWAGLSRLQRFALIKLSRPGHENRNFLPACDEFGLS